MFPRSRGLLPAFPRCARIIVGFVAHAGAQTQPIAVATLHLRRVRRHAISRACGLHIPCLCCWHSRTASVRALLQNCVSETLQPPLPTNEANKKDGAVRRELFPLLPHEHPSCPSRTFPYRCRAPSESFQATKAGFLVWLSVPWSPHYDGTVYAGWEVTEVERVHRQHMLVCFWKCDIPSASFQLLSRRIVAAIQRVCWSPGAERGEAASWRL